MYEAAITRGELDYASAVRGRCMHIHTGGTATACEGCGAGSILRTFAADTMAAMHGFRNAVVEPAHPATNHIWQNKLGFVSRGELVVNTYATKKAGEGGFKEAGTKPWGDLPDNEKITVCEKRIAPNTSCWASKCCFCCLTCAVECKCASCCIEPIQRPPEEDIVSMRR